MNEWTDITSCALLIASLAPPFVLLAPPFVSTSSIFLEDLVIASSLLASDFHALPATIALTKVCVCVSERERERERERGVCI